MKNKTYKQLAALLTAAVMMSGVFSGCQGNAPAEGEAAETTSVQESVTSASESTEPAAEAPAASEETSSAAPLSERYNGNIISVEPTEDKGEGLIGCKSSFMITLDKAASAETVSDMLTLSPDVPFEVKTSETDNSFLVSPSKELPSGKLVRLGLKNGSGDSLYKWAFQTEDIFKVRSTYPADGSDYVHIDTGIEMTFSSEVDSEAAEAFFEISPKVSGHLESHLSTLYFIPDKSLEEDKNYTVTLKKGLPSKDGTVLEESRSFGFKTSKDYSKSYCYTADSTETFVPGDLTVAEIFCSEDYFDKDFNVDIYRIDSIDSYISSLSESKNGDEVSTAGLEKVYSETSRLHEGGDYHNAPRFLMLPDDMEEGWYLCEITAQSGNNVTKIQRHIQISTISVYCASLPGQAQFFINDTASGNAAEGAKIELITDNGSYTATADKDGLALMDIPEENYGRGILKISFNGKTYGDIYRYSADGADDPSDSYFMYLFTDRETYLTSDTVQVWGVVRPRTTEGKLPEELRLVFGEGGYWDNEDTVLESKDITLGKDGTFTAEFTYKNHANTWGSLIALYSGDTKLCSKYITVKDYDKPLYTVAVDAPDYVMLYDGETVPVEITAAYYDTTPAEGIEFEMNNYGVTVVSPEKIVTDKNGKARAEIKFDDEEHFGIRSEWVRAAISGVQDVYSSGEKCVYTFSRDIMAECKWDKETGELSFTANHITLDNIPEGYEYEYKNYDVFKGAPADTEITAEITHSYSVKTENGSHYDFLQKKNITDYKYETVTEELGVFKVTTENGKAVLADNPIKKNNGSYEIKFSWKDSKGRNTYSEYFPCGYDYYSPQNITYRYYTFEAEDREDIYDLRFTENQTIPFTLKKSSSDEAEKCEGRILFTVHGNDFTDSRIFTNSSFEYTMTRECIPTVNVCGAYFDGRHIYPVHESWMNFNYDPSERRINLEVSSDKETYLPGDTVSITISARYEDGSPASGASMLLSVVDEAAFAMGEQYTDVLGKLYQSIYIPAVTEYFSYVQHTLDRNYGGEMGGGGDEWAVRKDFKDTAMFSESTADSSGTAHFTFKLPDNLTTWRATALAVSYEKGEGSGKSSAIYAGNTKYPVVVKQPVFLSPIMPDSFHTGDDVVLAANLHGADEVSITVSGEGINKTLSGSSGGSVSFGKLPEGEYKALFKAEGAEGKDAAEYTFNVCDTLLEVPVVMVSDISALNSADSLRWPVRITFFNKDYMLYTDVLYKLSEYHGSRADTTIASAYAMKEFGFITEEEYLKSSVSFDSDGYVKLLDASEGDPLLTARLIAAVPEIMGSSTASVSYNNIIKNRDSSAAEVSDAYLGLAALGEPVMIQIRRILADESSGFEGLDRLKLIAALAVIGDCDTASGYLSEYLADAERTETDEGIQLCIKGTDTLEYTKYALVAAAAAGLPEADGMARYIVNTVYVYDTAAPELIYYLKHYSTDAASEAAFSYNSGNEQKLVTLDRHLGTCIGFGEEQFKAADFKAVSGNIRTFMNYSGRVTDITAKKNLGVTKTLSADSGGYRPGALVTVNITTSEPYCYVTDIIPSCGRYVDNGSCRCSKQTVTLYTDKDGRAEYKFRIAVSGEFVAEGAYACGRDNVCGITETQTITVK